VGSTGDPVRLVDSRSATKLGLSQALTAKVPQSFQVAASRDSQRSGRGRRDSDVVNQTVHGYVAIGPGSTNSRPGQRSTSDRGGVFQWSHDRTRPGRQLSVVYMASSGICSCRLRLTGYFLANADGDTFYNLEGTRFGS